MWLVCITVFLSRINFFRDVLSGSDSYANVLQWPLWFVLWYQVRLLEAAKKTQHFPLPGDTGPQGYEVTSDCGCHLLIDALLETLSFCQTAHYIMTDNCYLNLSTSKYNAKNKIQRVPPIQISWKLLCCTFLESSRALDQTIIKSVNI